MKSQQKLPKATKKKPMSKKAFVALAHKVGQSLQEEQQEKCTCIDTTEGHNLYCLLNNQLTSPHSEAWHKRLSNGLRNIVDDKISDERFGMLKRYCIDLILQTREETVREMEGVIGEDESTIYANGDMYELAKRTERVGRNHLRAEQRQRLAQYKNSKGGI